MKLMYIVYHVKASWLEYNCHKWAGVCSVPPECCSTLYMTVLQLRLVKVYSYILVRHHHRNRIFIFTWRRLCVPCFYRNNTQCSAIRIWNTKYKPCVSTTEIFRVSYFKTLSLLLHTYRVRLLCTWINSVLFKDVTLSSLFHNFSMIPPLIPKIMSNDMGR